MDFHLKQSRNQSDPKTSKFLLQQQQPTAPLPLFVPDSNTKSTSILSALPHSSPPRMWGCFSVAQRQELELQALIFRYMLAGAAVPTELLQPIKKSLLNSTPFPLHHFPHYPSSWYWGRAAMDPEPGRCRRTDGKKWRCSRDVVAGQKYCERHMHRGRNRSRKPVETATANSAVAAAGAAATNRAAGLALLTVESGNYFSLSGESPSVDLLHLNRGGCSDSTQTEGAAADGKSDGHILRHFFDENGGSIGSLNQQMNSGSASATSLSISSDVSLKLSTGGEDGGGHGEREELQLNWAAGWAASQMASMGGPLAEALRSASNGSSPTSVLQQLQRAAAAEAGFIST